MRKFAIVGMGCAGYHAIKAMRESGFEGEIHVFSDVEHPPANPMLTTYYISGRISRDRMFPFGNLEALKNTYDVTLHLDERAERVDTASKSVIVKNRDFTGFDRILLSTGARAIAPPLGQGGSGRTFLMRTVSDADALKAMLDTGTVKSAVVVGASMVGIKVAELLYNLGIKVYMADMAERLFPLAATRETADILETDLRNRGIELLLKHGVDHVEETSEGVKTYLTGDNCIASDILVLCIGTRANVELVANTDVVENEPVLINRGIVANESMQTNIADIYAAGDCCEALNIQTGRTMIIGLWANAAIQGRVAGCCMAGRKETYKGSIPNNITHYFDETFIGIGDPNLEGEHFFFTNSAGSVSAVYGDTGLMCVNILGNYRVSGMIRDHMIKMITGEGEPFSLSDAGLLLASGIPAEFIKMLTA